MGRPSSPPLALISSAQICLDIRWALPEEASPPVSDTPKPILIGSCACAEKNAPDNVTATASSDMRGHAFGADDTSGLLSARKPRCEMGPCPPLQRAANCVGAAQPNNTFCILPRLHIRRAISHASPLANDPGAKIGQATLRPREGSGS